ncbi:MAG: hypothetical protein PVH61_13965 [Candidatus Aminicenantes bacterium]|jgi:prophage antirepressor-like protein
MQFITKYNFQGNDISFYVEGNVIWFDAAQISIVVGYWSEGGIAFEVNIGVHKKELKPHAKEIILPEHKRKKTLMISEVGILNLFAKYSDQKYQDFLKWYNELKQKSIQLQNAIKRQA